jgi:hypothetical protein
VDEEEIMENLGALQQFISVPERRRTPWEIIAWWELRRLPYNLVVGLAGMLGLLLFIWLGKVPPALVPEPTVEPLPVILFGAGANFFYTAGWVTELSARGLWPDRAAKLGPQLLFTGSLLSVMLALFPALAAFVAWAWRAVSA